MRQLKNDLRALVLTWQVEGKINHSRIRHIKTEFARMDLSAAIAAQGV
tara:strand:+ start:1647 stop:1790 length:144 start_codon:yes stop_codon:yes gene_type:complete